MINRGKLIPRSSKSNTVKSNSVSDLYVIKGAAIKVDNILKERLVLSKVREGILRQEEERRIRSGREMLLEKDVKNNYNVEDTDKVQKKKTGLGGLLGTVFKGILGSLGSVAFGLTPSLLGVGLVLKKLTNPFLLITGVALTALNVIVSKSGSQFKELNRKVKKDDISAGKIERGVIEFRNSLLTVVGLYASGSLVGAGARRLIGGRTFTEKQAVNFLETQKRELRAGKTTRAKKFNKKIRNERQRGLLIDDNFAINPKSKTFTQLAEVEVASEMAPRRIPKGMTPYQYQTLYGDAEVREIGEGSTMRGGDVVSRSKKGSTPRKRITKLKPDATSVRDATGRKRISTDPYEIAMQPRMEKLAKDARRMFPDFTNKQIIEIVRRERESSVRLKKLLPESELKRIDPQFYKRFKQAQRDINKQTTKQRMAAAFDKNKGKFPEKMTIAERLAQKAANEQRAIARKARFKTSPAMRRGMTGQQLGFSRILDRGMLRVGGRKLMKSTFGKGVKSIIRNSVNGIPLIGDLIALLLDVFVFGEPVGRAAFMAVGSIIGGIIGGVAGLLGGPVMAMIGGLVGSISGDLLGAAFYDLIFRKGNINVGDRFGNAITRGGFKAGVAGALSTGGFANFGRYLLGEEGREFVLDADSTAALENNYPGLLMALNKSDGAGAIELLKEYASYENEGRVSFVPIPIPSVSKPNETIVVLDPKGMVTSKRSYSEHYRRG